MDQGPKVNTNHKISNHQKTAVASVDSKATDAKSPHFRMINNSKTTSPYSKSII